MLMGLTLMHDGILLVDKPQNMSSHDVVVAIRRMTGMRQVGHTGTLDPHAHGLLVLCLGRATKFARFFEGRDKTYWTVMQLGIRTDTQDATGTIISRAPVPNLSREKFEGILGGFIGSLQQIPPMYSALKHQGQRLYHLARQGLTVSRQPRQIYVRRLTLLDLRREWATLAVTCSKGTYIRTVCEDIGLALGCGAHMTDLQRCRVGSLPLSQAHSLSSLQESAQRGSFPDMLIPLGEALNFLPSLELTGRQYEAIRLGRRDGLATCVPPSNGLRLTASGYRLCTKTQGPFAVMHQLPSSPEKWRVQYFDSSSSAQL